MPPAWIRPPRCARASLCAFAIVAGWGAACTLTTPLDGLSGEIPAHAHLDASGGGAGNDATAGGSAGSGGTDANAYDADDYLYGTLSTVSFATTFILDGDKLNDAAYETQHPEAFQAAPAFVGTYTTLSKPIPSPDAEETRSYALQTQGTVVVYQQDEKSAAVVSPFVLLQFVDNAVSPGTKLLNHDAVLAVFDFDGGGQMCAAALAYGEIQVTVASNTAATDGGSLELHAAGLKLYYPKITPDGDQSSMFDGLGGVCQVQ
jgi:hypothetical protein